MLKSKKSLGFLHPGTRASLDIELNGIQDQQGLEILAEMKSKMPEQRIGMISVNSSKDAVHQAQKLGANFFLVKPCKETDLSKAIEAEENVADYIPEPGYGRIIVF